MLNIKLIVTVAIVFPILRVRALIGALVATFKDLSLSERIEASLNGFFNVVLPFGILAAFLIQGICMVGKPAASTPVTWGAPVLLFLMFWTAYSLGRTMQRLIDAYNAAD